MEALFRRKFHILLSAGWKDQFPNAFTFVARPGRYVIQPEKGHAPSVTAWNAWNGAVQQNPDGSYAKGWLTSFFMVCPAFDPASPLHPVRSRVWPNIHQAIANAPSGQFDLTETAPVTVQIMDSHHDDIGGLTLSVSEYDLAPAKP